MQPNWRLRRTASTFTLGIFHRCNSFLFIALRRRILKRGSPESNETGARTWRCSRGIEERCSELEVLIVLGSGVPFVSGTNNLLELELVNSIQYPTGVTQNHYSRPESEKKDQGMEERSGDGPNSLLKNRSSGW